MSKIELGGGTKPRRDGYINIDVVEGADIHCNLDRDTLPFPDDSVEDVYSSHALEHLDNLFHVLHEIVRVCRVGAHVEIRVPHWNQSMAMAAACGHRRTISHAQVRHWCKDFIEDWWPKSKCKKRLEHLRTEYIPGELFGKAKDLFGWMTDEDIMMLIPDTCHENRYYFRVIPNT